MRNLIDIMHTPHIVISDVYRDRKGDPIGLAGWCEFPDKKFKGTLICGFNEDGMEHVSVSSYKKRQLPDWETMCRIKDAFWQDEEMAVQIHPKRVNISTVSALSVGISWKMSCISGGLLTVTGRE